jgi:hypothetical protein
MGVRYEMPDMTREQITEVHEQLDQSCGPDHHIIVLNVSEVVLSLPKRILKRAGSGDRCFWEAT